MDISIVLRVRHRFGGMGSYPDRRRIVIKGLSSRVLWWLRSKLNMTLHADLTLFGRSAIVMFTPWHWMMVCEIDREYGMCGFRFGPFGVTVWRSEEL